MDYPLVYNDRGEYVLISHLSAQLQPTLYHNGQKLEPIRRICSHGHSDVYIWTHLPYKSTVKLFINNTIFTKTVTRYPSFKDKLIAAVLVLREEAVIKQWIHYHLKLGIQHFIVYDNAPIGEDATPKLLADEIAHGIVIYIRWNYPAESLKAQPIQQNHAIYTWRTAAYIGQFDVDEFMNPLGEERSLRRLLDDVVGDRDLGGVEVLSRIFENPDNLGTENFDFLRTGRCTETIHRVRQKLFAIPRNVEIFCVHVIVKGKPHVTVDPEQLRFHHYWFLTSVRGKQRSSSPIVTPLQDLTILRHIDCNPKLTNTVANPQP